MVQRRYTRIDQVWIDDFHVFLQYQDGTFLARIPMNYLQQSGTSNWQLVYVIVQALIVEPVVIFDCDGMIISNPPRTPSPGLYYVRHRDGDTKQEGNQLYMPLDETASSKSESTTEYEPSVRISISSGVPRQQIWITLYPFAYRPLLPN